MSYYMMLRTLTKNWFDFYIFYCTECAVKLTVFLLGFSKIQWKYYFSESRTRCLVSTFELFSNDCRFYLHSMYCFTIWYSQCKNQVWLQANNNKNFRSQNLSNGNYLGALFAMIGCCVSTSNLFLYCYYGQVSTESFLRFGDSIYESNLYNLPNNLQRSSVVMIANAQKPIFFHGCGIFHLSLNLFARVSLFSCAILPIVKWNLHFFRF